MWKKVTLNATCITIAATLLISCSKTNTEHDPGRSTKKSTLIDIDRQKIDELVLSKIESQKIPGVSMAIVYRGKTVYKKSYGFANIEHSVRVKTESPFKIASLTKPITAIAIMQLVENEKITLDDKIELYIDSIPASWKTITIRQLITHTSGLADYFQAPAWSWRNSWKLDLTHHEFLKMCSESQLVFQPGERMQYCNTGYYLLGMVIEKASGMSYAEYLSKHIFEPIGMSNSQQDRSRLIIRDRVSGYTLNNGRWKIHNLQVILGRIPKEE